MKDHRLAEKRASHQVVGVLVAEKGSQVSTETQRLSTDENQGNRPGVALYGEINEKNISAKMTRIAK